jgi:hypothetical protein
MCISVIWVILNSFDYHGLCGTDRVIKSACGIEKARMDATDDGRY